MHAPTTSDPRAPVGDHVEISISVRRATRFVWAGYGTAAVLLIGLQRLCAGSSIAAVRRLTSLERSDGITSWVVASLALVVALAAWLVFVAVRGKVAGRGRGWGFVAVLASLVAFDRGTRVVVLVAVVEQDSSGRVPESGWLLLWAVAGLVAMVFAWRDSRHRRTRLWLTIAGCGFVAAGLLDLAGSDGELAGSAEVLCVGAGLTAALASLLARLSSEGSIEFTLTRAGGRRFLRTLAGGAIAIFLMLYGLEYLTGGPSTNSVVKAYFNPANEASLASWVATTQTFLFALTLWLIGWVTRGRGSVRARGWLILAAAFTYVSFDDGSMFHERVATIVNAATDSFGQGSLVGRFPSYTWQFVFLPVLAAVAVFALLFLWTELKRPALRALLLAGLACFSLAIGLDYIEGLRRAEESAEFRHRSKVIEETLEMLGMTLLWVSVLAHATANVASIRLRFPSAR